MKFDAVLFDCDGVLADSEPITCGVLRDMLDESGWTLTVQACMAIFVGTMVKDHAALIESHTGRPLTEDWLQHFRERRNAALRRDLTPVRGAVDAVRAIHSAYGGRIACASGADRFKVELQLAQCGLMPYFEGRIFSGHETPRSKPFPDVYLAASRALGVDPARCAVVEDTVTGVRAGVAAGATVFGYSPGEPGHAAPAELAAAGAVQVLGDWPALADLLVAARAAGELLPIA
jgi:HAD superfamily hydrolase (TIGR01509 family)